MDGYGIIGVALFFATLIAFSYILLHSHGIKIDLEDKELKRAARIIRLRNIMTALGLIAIAVFFMLLDGIPAFSPGTAARAMADTASTATLIAGIGLLVIAACLGIISRRADFNFRRSLQQYAVREKIHAALKFRHKPAIKPKRTNRV